MKTIIFDLSGTLVKMRPATLLVRKNYLEKLSKEFYLAIVTGARKAETNNILTKLNIKSYFKIVLCKEDLIYSKKNPKAAINVKNNIRNILWYVGDSSSDFKLSDNLDLPFIYIGKNKIGNYQVQNVNEAVRFIMKNW